MKINKLKISNYGSFADLVEFDFSLTSLNKNIILIGGKNGSGKTTIFNAIKIALYGPLAHGFNSVHQLYLDQIRINKDSLLKTDVYSFVELEIELEEERETAVYQICREWVFERKRLTEKSTIKRLGVLLNNDETFAFENYLKTFIPPQLFDLFFFDGEQISKFFFEGHMSQNIKEALSILRGYDSFEIIQQHLDRNIRKNVEKAVTIEEKHYLEQVNKRNDLYTELQQVIDKETQLDIEIALIEKDRESLEISFRNAGGLIAQELSELKAQLIQEERLREEKHEQIRQYANEMLPFLMVIPLVRQVKEQLEKEQQYNRYQMISSLLNHTLFESILSESLPNNAILHKSELANRLTNGVAKKLKPNFDVETFRIIHSLSQDDYSDVLHLIEEIERSNNNDIRQLKQAINMSIQRTTEIRKKIETAEENDHLNEINLTIESINERLKSLIEEKLFLNTRHQLLQSDIEKVEGEIKKSVVQLTKARKDKSVVALCIRAKGILDGILPKLIQSEVKPFKENFFRILGVLIAKEFLIDEIDITDDFEITLYHHETKTITELLTLHSKLGLDGMQNILGNKCIQTLLVRLGINDIKEIEKKLKKYPLYESFTIPIKVDINTLSKGEQQIYIMSLYWALIKTANIQLPFVIDTPYARIDETHRDRITTKFFPSLSHQVIILSTDSEITEEYYKLLKPYIANEYTINFSSQHNCTVVDEKYFFEVPA